MLRLAVLFLIVITLNPRTHAQVDELTRQEDSVLECSSIQLHLDEKSKLYANLQASHLERYQTVIVKLESIISKAQTLGFDTTEFEKNADTLKLLADSFTQLHVSLQNYIKTAHGLVCTTNEAAYVSARLNITNTLNQLQETTREIYSLIHVQLRANLVALREWRASNAQ